MDKIIDDRTPKKKKFVNRTKKYPYFRNKKYKAGDIIGNKTIIRFVMSRGGHHYYSTKCGNCNQITVIHQESIRRSVVKGVGYCGKCSTSPFRKGLRASY